MLLALGPLQLDPTVRTVVVGLATAPDPACIERAAVGADALWLGVRATPAHVAEAGARCGLPVGVTVDDLGALGDLVAAGAVAVEPSPVADVTGLVAAGGLTIWCTPAQARRAVEDGVAQGRLVVEGGGTDDPGVPGASVAGTGPPSWGAALRRVVGGARILRTSDARAARRVATVADRLIAARAAAHEGGEA